ncbi:glycosyltransferase [Planctomycetota bacterium]
MKSISKERLTSDSSGCLSVTAPIDMELEEEQSEEQVLFRRRLMRWLWHFYARQFMLFFVMALRIAILFSRRQRRMSIDGRKVLLTGRFDSNNWIINHIGPLAASKQCSRLWMVSDTPVPGLPKVIAIYPPKWIARIVGRTTARMLTFCYVAFVKRPDVVGGFNIMINGIMAIIIGRLIGANSMYFCVGGPAEIRDGGIRSSEHCFREMKTPDQIVERRFLKVISESDIIITMGTSAVTFFKEKGINSDFHVVSGGINPVKYQPSKSPPEYDLIVTGRLVEIKRIDIFLLAIKKVIKDLPDLKVAIVGDGNLIDEFRALAQSLGIDHNVHFAGHQGNIEDWLCNSKVFVLTSDSEGLSLSMMEAMMCGLPAVVSDVGDLGDLVKHGVNGFLVPRRSPDAFAERIIELLSDTEKLESFSKAARCSALRHTTQATTDQWNCILANIC